MPAPDPRTTYQTRHNDYRDQCAHIESRIDRIGLARLAAGAVGVALLILIFGLRWVSLGWFGRPIVLILALSAWYARLKGRRNVCRRAQAFCERGLARVDDAWMGMGDPG